MKQYAFVLSTVGINRLLHKELIILRDPSLCSGRQGSYNKLYMLLSFRPQGEIPVVYSQLLTFVKHIVYQEISITNEQCQIFFSN